MNNPIATVLEFVARINRRDVAGMTELMAPDHRFIDPAGAVVSGLDHLRRAWLGYFHMVPDCWIAVDRSFSDGDTVVLVGRAGGTYAPDGRLSPERRWEVPATWRAVVQGSCVVEWQVYADSEPMRRLMNEPPDV